MKSQLRPTPRPSHLRRLVSPFVAPDVFDFWAGRVNRSWTWERPRARLLSREAAARDAVTLVLKPNRHWQGYQAGQHVTLGVEIDGVRYQRSYSLVEAPRADRRLVITIKAVEGGKVSRYLLERARAGEVFELSQAYGELSAAPAQAPGLLLAAGSGITPLVALLREQAAAGLQAPLDLVYWVRERAQACFLDELRALAARQPLFRLHLALTGDAPAAADELAGRIGTFDLDQRIADLPQRHVIACGPGGFVETARGLLGQAASFQAEAFSPAPAAVTDEGEVDVILQRSGRTLRLARGTSLLVALEAAGLKPRHGCRMGICNTCSCGKSAGSTRHLPSGDLAHEPTQALKLCIHSAATDLELDL
jgi:ferredoxin-NADP reductase